jgi:hypothetical protein
MIKGLVFIIVVFLILLYQYKINRYIKDTDNIMEVFAHGIDDTNDKLNDFINTYEEQEQYITKQINNLSKIYSLSKTEISLLSKTMLEWNKQIDALSELYDNNKFYNIDINLSYEANIELRDKFYTEEKLNSYDDNTRSIIEYYILSDYNFYMLYNDKKKYYSILKNHFNDKPEFNNAIDIIEKM